jgi:acetolactate synthase-1/2/3 large subunit
VKAGIESLSSGVRARKTWAQTRASEIRSAHKAAFASRGTWGPVQIVEIVRKVFPRNTLATADSGAHRIVMSHVWEAYDERTVLQSSGLCTMGCALPLAIGAKIADPETPVVAFTGDAGLLMVLGELSTLAELALPITIVVFVDASLTLIEMKQRQRQLPNAGVDFGHHDFAAIAQAFGGAGETVSDAVSLERALNDALTRTRQFTVIAAEIDRGAYDGRF